MTRPFSRRWWSYSNVVASSVATLADADRARMGSRARFRVSWRLVVIFLAMKFITVPLTIVVCSALAGSARAEMAAPSTPVAPAAAPADDAKATIKSVTGTVVAMTKRSLSLEYKVEEKGASELLLPFGADMQFERLKSLHDLHPGDTVTVLYRQRYHDAEDGGEPIILSTDITSLTLVKSKTDGLHSTQ